ncbi:AMP-binding protein [Streptomyces sp. YGL11-2]|uniref:AMP-binding protein n=1 Tax=Streptomyces sp. YGL11-2 TaxID=3414028 RepID=UPI003CEC7979
MASCLPTPPLGPPLGPLLDATRHIPRTGRIRSGHLRARRSAHTVNRTGADVLMGSPALLDHLARHCIRTLTPLPSLSHVLSVGVYLPYETLDRLRVCLPAATTVYSVYCAAGSIPVSAIDHRQLLALRPATDRGQGVCLGRPVPGTTVRLLPPEVSSTEPDAAALSSASVGELAVTGPCFRYCSLDPVTTTPSVKSFEAADEAVHRTGHAGRLDDQGRIWFYGRLDRQLRTPQGPLLVGRVEPALNAVPGVHRAVLVGVGPAAAQRPVVVVEPERRTSRADRTELCRGIQRALEDLDLPIAGAGAAPAVPVLFHRLPPIDHGHPSATVHARLSTWAATRLTEGT